MRVIIFLVVAMFITTGCATAQNRTISKDKTEKKAKKEGLSDAMLSGLKFRSVGPAFASGRIADIAIHPNDDNLWYVAVGSGGVWKTNNAGVTWNPIFDNESSYSTGCVTIDPINHNIIWVGTGENVGGRHVGFGDGVYKSVDAGKSWTNMGLKKSEHISKIIVHPDNSNVIWVAAQGPLWKKGDERGLYKSTDGGSTWKKTLGDAEWVGVTDLIMDPRDPDVLYAATWQRHRTVAAFMGGGPGSGLHKSTDGGDTWTKLTNGIPKSNLGKIGICLSPQNPDVVYAAIELDRTKGGVFRSTNKGTTWSKMSDAVSGATGPHYYQELYACPHQEGRLYLMDVRIQVSDDHGRNFRRLSERDKHSDNHAIAFRADDPDYLLVGTDAGIYESFDLANTWRFIDNLPLTQYYKVALDDREPFYHIFGGTQDNGSHGGPSGTDNRHGIRNGDWYKTLGADGHQSATEPGNPNIMYAETQQGGMHRVDLSTGEQVYIQPQPEAGEDYERFNWDAPIVVSPHSPTRLYFASQRVWRSENRGDSWTAISGDLTKDQERIELPIMGRQQSWDNPWDVGAMSNYNTVTSIAESPLQEGLLYAGTDDGIVQITEDGGANWRKVEASQLSGLPSTAFCNDLKADLHDANTVYAAFDNHKYGDFTPYLYKSTNRGVTWQSIARTIPERHLVWRIVQDHESPNLFFLATEFGIFTSVDGGNNWMKMKGGLPTIPFRDLAIQKRENDLVGASFGRGFYVLDDYSVLRELSDDTFKKDAVLFAGRDADWYIPRSIAASPGSAAYVADNPMFGAVFTYHIKDGFEAMKSSRKKSEKKLAENNQNIPFPGWDAIDAENDEEKSKLWLTIKDSKGDVIKRVESKSGKGLQRIAWDLRRDSRRAISLEDRGGGRGGWRSRGPMVPPGKYTASLTKQEGGTITELTDPVEVNVNPLREGALKKPMTYAEVANFGKRYEEANIQASAAFFNFQEGMKKVNAMRRALNHVTKISPELTKELFDLHADMKAIERKYQGSSAKEEIGERNNPTIWSRIGVARRGMSTTYGPTETHLKSMSIAEDMVQDFAAETQKIIKDVIPTMERKLQDAGAPWIEGQALPIKPE